MQLLWVLLGLVTADKAAEMIKAADRSKAEQMPRSTIFGQSGEVPSGHARFLRTSVSNTCEWVAAGRTVVQRAAERASLTDMRYQEPLYLELATDRPAWSLEITKRAASCRYLPRHFMVQTHSHRVPCTLRFPLCMRLAGDPDSTSDSCWYPFDQADFLASGPRQGGMTHLASCCCPVSAPCPAAANHFASYYCFCSGERLSPQLHSLCARVAQLQRYLRRH